MNDREIRLVMTPAPATTAPETTVAEAWRLMRARRCHHLPVVDADGVLVGMLSSSDLPRALAGATGTGPEDLAARLRQCPVGEVMNRNLSSIPQTATLLDAVRVLQTGSFHALPVVAPGNVLAGMVTSTDLIEALHAMLEFSPDPAAAGEHGGQLAIEANRNDDQRCLQDLTRLYHATKLYLHSGRGESEHTRLLVAFNSARECMEVPGRVL